MALYTPEYQPTGDEVAVFTTSKGVIRAQLAGKDAPIQREEGSRQLFESLAKLLGEPANAVA